MYMLNIVVQKLQIWRELKMTDYVAAFTEVLWSKNFFASLPPNHTLQVCVFTVVITCDKLQLANFVFQSFFWRVLS